MPSRRSTSKLPLPLERKLYKTGQTRGADDDEIYQNRVNRNSTVLIPYPMWAKYHPLLQEGEIFENGFIVLISPEEYFNDPNIDTQLETKGLVLGKNTLVFYETRESWNANNPALLNWEAANRRISPLEGKYVARIPATTSHDGGTKIIQGFTTTSSKGAGIRVYEYASGATIAKCREQLEAIIWFCFDANTVLTNNGMSEWDITIRKTTTLQKCKDQGLLDMTMLENARIVNKKGRTICPLCLQELSAQGFFNRVEQAEGRIVLDLTITQLNLFHIEELKYGIFSHKPYNLGWGHHHCNVVVKDSGITATLEWMHKVLEHNQKEGYYSIRDKIDN